MHRPSGLATTWMVVLVTTAACSRPSASATASPDPATKPSPSTPPVPSAPPDASSDASIVLPPVEDACTKDADCGVTSLDLTGPTICCFRCCSMHGGSAAWVARVTAICKAANPDCPAVACACPSPPYKPKCISGHCGLTY